MHGEESAIERIKQQMEEHFAWCHQSGLPLYGLPETYQGPRMLGDAQRMQQLDRQAGKQVKSGSRIELVHGDLSTRDPALQVSTATLPGPTIQQLFDIETNQRQRLAPGGLIPLTLSILVNGIPTTFQGYQTTDAWAVQTSKDGFSISVVGLYWPLEKLELISIDDVDPYIVGRDQMIQRLKQHRTP